MNSLDTITFTRKKQKNENCKILNDENFYLNPSLEIIITDPTIKEIDIKYIIFKCNKDDSLKLKKFSDLIINKFKELYDDAEVYPIGEEYIRCSLPTKWSPYKSTNKYKIYHYECLFYIDNVKANINSNSVVDINKYKINKIIIEVKNIWKSGNSTLGSFKYGFHTQVKEIYLSSCE